MKLWKWIKSLFINNNGSVKKTEATPPVKPLPEIPTKEEVDSFPTNKTRIAIVRGHGGDDGGADGNGTNEVEYNTWVMKYIEASTRRNVKCFYGNSSMGAVLSSLTFNPDITIQLHLNSYNGQAHGCEVLVVKGDEKSYALAEKFAKDFTSKFGRTLRRPESKGKKILESSDRGVSSLKASIGKKILVEPFFIDNKTDFVAKEEYAKFLKEFIDGI